MDSSTLSTAISTTSFSEFTSSPRPRLVSSTLNIVDAADTIGTTSEDDKKDVDCEVEKMSRFALQREMGVEMGCHHPYLGMGFFTGADDTTPPRAQRHTYPPIASPPSPAFLFQANTTTKHTHTLHGILSVLQASTRQIRADPTVSQKRFFRILAPLVVFLYLLVAGAVLPTYIKRHSPPPSSSPVSTLNANSRIVPQPFHGVHPHPHPSVEPLPPHSLLPSALAHLSNAHGVDVPMVIFIFLVGLLSSLFLLRTLIFIAGRCLKRFCDLDLVEVFRPRGACRDVHGKGVGQTEMIFGGVV